MTLPQYLLQDLRQSYPPLFPAVLALLPRWLLDRAYWLVAPIIDCVHLAFLYWLAFTITQSVPVAVLSGAVYAVIPQLISENRSLSARSFGALLHSMAVVLNLRYVVFDDPWPWLPLAALAGGAVFLASASAAAAYVAVIAAFTVVFHDVRYLTPGLGALAAALLVGRGHLVQVLANYLHALAYWRRNRRRFGAHPVRDSPVYGDASRAAPMRPGFLGHSRATQLLRLAGENPFVFVLPFATHGIPPWGEHLYAWAATLTATAVVAAVVPPLATLGAGRVFVKMAIFPTAYSIAVAVGSPRGFDRPAGRATVLAVAVSGLAIAFFYFYLRTRRTEHTASTPAGLSAAVAHLSRLPGGGVFCLPYHYADFTAYRAGKSVLWGGHCGNHRRLEAVAPVITRPLPELFAEYGVDYVLLERPYASPADLRLDGHLLLEGAWSGFELYRFQAGDVTDRAGRRGDSLDP